VQIDTLVFIGTEEVVGIPQMSLALLNSLLGPALHYLIEISIKNLFSKLFSLPFFNISV